MRVAGKKEMESVVAQRKIRFGRGDQMPQVQLGGISRVGCLGPGGLALGAKYYRPASHGIRNNSRFGAHALRKLTPHTIRLEPGLGFNGTFVLIAHIRQELGASQYGFVLRAEAILFLRTRCRRHDAVGAVVGHKQAIVLPHVLGKADPVAQMRDNFGVAGFLNFRGSVFH